MSDDDIKKDSISVGGEQVVINQFSSTNEDKGKKKWVIPLATTLVGILATTRKP